MRQINFALPGAGPAAMPRFAAERSDFTLCAGTDAHERAWDEAKHGRASTHPYVDCVVPTYLDPGLAPEGRHVLTAFVNYAPYHLAEGDWSVERERLADRVTDTITEFAPNFRASVLARDILSPVDLETRFGLTEGNIFHGDLNLGQLFLGRPSPAGRYPSVRDLYRAAPAWRGVAGAPGWNARSRSGDWNSKSLR